MLVNTPATPRRTIHRVGLTACAVGLASLYVFVFAEASPNRVVSGQPMTIVQAVSGWWIVTPALLWSGAASASLVRAHTRTASILRGIFSAALIVAVLWLSGSAASESVQRLGEFTRYTIGGGVWLSIFAAFALIVSGRRELGLFTPAGWLVTLSAPLGIVGLVLTGRLGQLGLAAEYVNVSRQFPVWVMQQFAYSAIAVVIAVATGVLLGIVAFRNQRFARPIFLATSVFQTIPGLAMIGILVVPISALSASFPFLKRLGISGLGWSPVVVALTLYALLAIVRNTYAGLGAVSASAVDAGVGMGMSERQVMRKVQLPLAAPILFSGIRTSSQQTIGNATLGAFVAAGTLGAPIFMGFAQQADNLVLLGAMALVSLALTVDGILRASQYLVTPAHRRRGRTR